MQYRVLESFHRKITTEEIFLRSAFLGCSSVEIDRIENHLNTQLPLGLREFLSICGRKWKGAYVLHSLQGTLSESRPYEILEKSIKRSKEDQGIKDLNVSEIVIIWFEEHLGDYHWSFYMKNDNEENPMIYSIYYEEFNEAPVPFTDYVEQKLETATKYAVNPHLPDYLRFQRLIEFVDPKRVIKLSINSLELVQRIDELFGLCSNVEEVVINLHSSITIEEIRIPKLKQLRELRISENLSTLIIPNEVKQNLDVFDVNANVVIE